MEEIEKYKLANDIRFIDAIMTAQEGAPILQKDKFKTIGDRVRLISELEKKGFKIVKL
jgi:hypothetical protein